MTQFNPIRIDYPDPTPGTPEWIAIEQNPDDRIIITTHHRREQMQIRQSFSRRQINDLIAALSGEPPDALAV